MAQDGIDYFPIDTGFLRDKKVLLVQGKYGAKGVLILIYILSRIYEEHGYYIRWDNDDCFLSADAIGCGVSPDLIGQVVNECIIRSMFSEQLYNEFGILTSHGIQWRFVRAAKKRNHIEFCQEYFLLDTSNPKDVPNGILNKITFLSLKVSGNSEKVSGEHKKVSGKKQSKVKESKVKEREREKEEKPRPEEAPCPYGEIIAYLNLKTGANYRDTGSETKKLIKARCNEGYTLDDFKIVIDKKAEEWGQEPHGGEKDMRPYLRPSTLFGNKFESYLNQKPVKRNPGSRNQFHYAMQRDTDYDALFLEQL